QILIALPQGRAVELGLRSVAPLNVDVIEKALGLPPARADRGDAARHDDNLLDALGLSSLETEARDLAAEGRGMAHGGIDLPGPANIDVERRSPCHLARQ